MTENENDYPVLYEISDSLFHIIREEDKEDYDSEDEEEDQEDSEQDEENPSEDDEQEKDESDSDNEDEENKEDDSLIPANVYKGLQRTVSKKDSEIAKLKKELENAEKEKADALAVLDKGDKVRLDLQKTIADQGKRLGALEQENQQSKLEAMQSRVLAEDFPGLAKLKNYIPSAETEDEYRKNCEGLQAALGEETTKILTKELSNSTPPVDDNNKPVSQAQVDKLYSKAMSLAGVRGKEQEYKKTFDEYLLALNSRNN